MGVNTAFLIYILFENQKKKSLIALDVIFVTIISVVGVNTAFLTYILFENQKKKSLIALEVIFVKTDYLKQIERKYSFESKIKNWPFNQGMANFYY